MCVCVCVLHAVRKYIPQKKGPLPVMTMALTPGSVDAVDSAPRNSAISCPDSALRLLDRFRARSLTPSTGDVAWTRPAATESDPDMLVIRHQLSGGPERVA